MANEPMPGRRAQGKREPQLSETRTRRRPLRANTMSCWVEGNQTLRVAGGSVCGAATANSRRLLKELNAESMGPAHARARSQGV